MMMMPSLALVVLPMIAAPWSQFRPSPYFGERVLDLSVERGVRVHINAPAQDGFGQGKPTRLVLYALPNGNTIQQTVGCKTAAHLDWHYDIQHIGAQTRLFRAMNDQEDVVVAYLQADGLSWPSWRAKHAAEGNIYGQIVDAVLKHVPGAVVKITLTGHSGGGSFCWGLMDERDAIPDTIDRIAFLDSNYSYNAPQHHHGDKLAAWLTGDEARHLVVIAYDDRDVTFKGKPIVGPTGGTYRASHRMLSRLGEQFSLTHGERDLFDVYGSGDRRVTFWIHRNPQRRILHTALVGDMNGYLHALTIGTQWQEQWGRFGGPRAYTDWLQPAPLPRRPPPSAGIPNRPDQAAGGRDIMRSVADLPLAQREAIILRELTGGNLPSLLRTFAPIRVSATDAKGRPHTIQYEAMPDYLAVGRDNDFVRVPITPQTAQRVADLFGCTLPTRKMVDDIEAGAVTHVSPRPMTRKREAVATFIEHNAIIEGQLAGRPRGGLVCGVKKDIVLSNRIRERPRRLAIYGWRKLDGRPIQPLTIVHVDTYVDYSHGARLVRRAAVVDGRPMDIEDVLTDPNLCVLLSDEGPITTTRYD